MDGERPSRAEQARDPGTDELAGMLAQSSFDAAPSGQVEWIQTHISHVFLTTDRVFKLRKAVRQPFLDFGSRDARNLDCQREVALNRRLVSLWKRCSVSESAKDWIMAWNESS